MSSRLWDWAVGESESWTYRYPNWSKTPTTKIKIKVNTILQSLPLQPTFLKFPSKLIFVPQPNLPENRVFSTT